MERRILCFNELKGEDVWAKVLKNGPSKICGRQPLKKLKRRPDPFKFFKGCLPQVLFGPFLNIFSHVTFVVS